MLQAAQGVHPSSGMAAAGRCGFCCHLFVCFFGYTERFMPAACCRLSDFLRGG